MSGQVGLAKVVGIVLVPVVGLGDEQIDAVRQFDEPVGPGRVTRVGDLLYAQVQASCQGWGLAGMLNLDGGDRRAGPRRWSSLDEVRRCRPRSGEMQDEPGNMHSIASLKRRAMAGSIDSTA